MIPYRPLTHWPYKRQPGDFQSHIDDLYFWGYIKPRPFRRIFTDPWDGMLNVEHKNRLNEIRREMRGGRRSKMFGGGPFYRSTHPKVPDAIEMARYRAARNRS